MLHSDAKMPPWAQRLAWSALRILTMLAVVALGLVVYALAITTMPGRSSGGVLPAADKAHVAALAQRLQAHVSAIASREHHARRPEALETAAIYLEARLEEMGYAVHRQVFRAAGVQVRNLEVTIRGQGSEPRPVLVVGAHYDSAPGTPGANDNATGAAAVLELARRLREGGAIGPVDILLVLYVNEEPPFFRSPLMGSHVHAQALRTRGVDVRVMLSLETLGYYSNEPGSQRYPWPLNALYPDRGNFVGFVGTTGDIGLVRRSVHVFRSHSPVLAEGIAAPRFIPGVDFSDHASYLDAGYPALMVTDTAPYRYPHYHKASDTPDKVNYEMLAAVVLGVEAVVRDWARSR